MIKFLVKVACVAHFHNCPIPQGYQLQVEADSKLMCEHQARIVVKALGHNPSDYRIECETR